MADRSHEKKVFMKEIYSYQKTNSIIFSVAFCMVTVLSFYVYQQVNIYLLPTTSATIVDIESGSYQYDRKVCNSNSKINRSQNCTNVTIERPIKFLTLEYNVDGRARTFTSSFYGYENFSVGDSLPINFYQNNPNLFIPSISKIKFMSFVLLLGFAAILRWLLHSYQANRIKADKSILNINTCYKELTASNKYAQVTGIFSSILYICTLFFDAYIMLIAVTVLIVPVLIAFAYFLFVTKFFVQFVAKSTEGTVVKSALYVWCASTVATTFIALDFSESIETYGPDSIMIQLALSAFFFTSLFKIKKLAHKKSRGQPMV
ncbi:MAG: hypothetical protein GY787_23635 [Alteromonadales bacterium]|nr:hypothetical protein [Alteromonadales bacterium]